MSVTILSLPFRVIRPTTRCMRSASSTSKPASWFLTTRLVCSVTGKTSVRRFRVVVEGSYGSGLDSFDISAKTWFAALRKALTGAASIQKRLISITAM